MEDPRQTLGEALRDLVRLYGDLATVIDDEAQAMVKRDMQQISNLTKAEERIHESIRIAETRRERYMTEVGKKLGIDTADMDLREVAEIAGGRFSGEYLRLRARLQEIAQRVAKKNKLKTLLCRESLEHVQKVVSLLIGNSADTGTYTPTGTRGGGGGQLLIDRRV